MDLISEPIQMTPHSQPYQDIAKGNFKKILSKKRTYKCDLYWIILWTWTLAVQTALGVIVSEPIREALKKYIGLYFSDWNPMHSS